MGSFAAVGVGVLGIVALGDRGDSTPATSAGSDESAAVTVEQVGSAQEAWQCHDQLAYWGEAGDEVYFASCERTTVDGTIQVLDLPTPTYPADEIATTVVSFPPTTIPPGYLPTSPTEQLYSVVAGDSVFGIAEMFGVDPDILVAYNEWPEGLNHPIVVGELVFVPPDALIPDGISVPGSPPAATTTSTTTTSIG